MKKPNRVEQVVWAGSQMQKCPNCSAEVGEQDTYCKSCGTKLSGLPQPQTKAEPSTDESVENVVVKRLDGIKNKDEAAVRALIDERYSKFDDWPPFTRQEAMEALKNEFGAFKVLSNYSYELIDFQTNVLGDTAIATFVIHYSGVIRDKPFEVTSRVTTVLKKQESGWKVAHEHFSRFPENTQQQAAMPQSKPSPSPPSSPVGSGTSRRFAIVGFVCAALGLFIFPKILGSAAIILGAYTWRRRQGNLGIIIVIVGILCMIIGIEVTAFL